MLDPEWKKLRNKIAVELNELMIRECKNSRNPDYVDPKKATIFLDALSLEVAFMINLIERIALGGLETGLLDVTLKAIRERVENHQDEFGASQTRQ